MGSLPQIETELPSRRAVLKLQVCLAMVPFVLAVPEEAWETGDQPFDQVASGQK